MVDPLVMIWALLFLAASLAAVIAAAWYARKHPFYVLRVVRPPHRETPPGLSSKCPECHRRYFYQHPSGRRDAYVLHALGECTATSHQEAA